MQDGTGRFKIAFFQLGDDAVSEVFCSVVVRELLDLRMVAVEKAPLDANRR